MPLVSLAPVLTPHGRLVVERDEDAPALDGELAQRMEGAFTRGSGHGLLALGADEIGLALPPAFSVWREFAAVYVTDVCTRPIDAAEPHRAHPPTPPKSELDQFVLAAPPIIGAEYLSAAVLSDLWQGLDRSFWAELTEAKCSIEEFLKRRNPATWRANRPPRAQVTATVGGRAPSGLGQAALLDFHLEVILDGERLSKAEVQDLLRTSDGLALVRGRWVEVDAERLRETLEHFGEIERTAAEQGISFREAMRMLAGTDVAADGNSAASVAEWGKVAAGPWLAETLKGLRTQEGLARVDPGPALKGTLRPYQQVGVRWR